MPDGLKAVGGSAAMPSPPALRRKAIEEIGAVLSKEALERIVKDATGNDIYNIYASEADSRATCVTKTLDDLEKEGTERWFLTGILTAVAQERLRILIVKAWPDTLVGLPLAEVHVAGALRNLNALLGVPLPTDLRHELRDKRDVFDSTLQRIATLYVYKQLHEYLYQLKLKLTFGEWIESSGVTDPDFSSIVIPCDVTGPAALAPLLGAHGDKTRTELDWISQLQALAASLASGAAASDTAACLHAIDRIHHLIGFHLSRLNKEVFKAATELSFEQLVYELPLDLELQDGFKELAFAVRELKSIILARALIHTLCQITENDLSLLEEFLNIPGQEMAAISGLWLAVKPRVAWLAALDPDDDWTKQARELADDIDDGLLGNQKLDGAIRARFEAYRNLFRFRFLAIDNALNSDCSSLRKLDVPLTDVLKELAR
jgi:hypothetical protein